MIRICKTVLTGPGPLVHSCQSRFRTSACHVESHEELGLDQSPLSTLAMDCMAKIVAAVDAKGVHQPTLITLDYRTLAWPIYTAQLAPPFTVASCASAQGLPELSPQDVTPAPTPMSRPAKEMSALHVRQVATRRLSRGTTCPHHRYDVAAL